MEYRALSVVRCLQRARLPGAQVRQTADYNRVSWQIRALRSVGRLGQGAVRQRMASRPAPARSSGRIIPHAEVPTAPPGGQGISRPAGPPGARSASHCCQGLAPVERVTRMSGIASLAAGRASKVPGGSPSGPGCGRLPKRRRPATGPGVPVRRRGAFAGRGRAAPLRPWLGHVPVTPRGQLSMASRGGVTMQVLAARWG